jgi:hypothetical protein
MNIFHLIAEVMEFDVGHDEKVRLVADLLDSEVTTLGLRVVEENLVVLVEAMAVVTTEILARPAENAPTPPERPGCTD